MNRRGLHFKASTMAAEDMQQAKLERRNAMLADTVGQQAKVIVRLRKSLDAQALRFAAIIDAIDNSNDPEAYAIAKYGYEKATEMLTETAAPPTASPSEETAQR